MYAHTDYTVDCVTIQNVHPLFLKYKININIKDTHTQINPQLVNLVPPLS